MGISVGDYLKLSNVERPSPLQQPHSLGLGPGCNQLQQLHVLPSLQWSTVIFNFVLKQNPLLPFHLLSEQLPRKLGYASALIPCFFILCHIYSKTLAKVL